MLAEAGVARPAKYTSWLADSSCRGPDKRTRSTPIPAERASVTIEIAKRLELEPHPAPVHLAVLSQLGKDLGDRLGRYGETHALGEADAPRVEADDLAVGVDEWTTGVARIDRGVGLEPEAILAGTG